MGQYFIPANRNHVITTLELIRIRLFKKDFGLIFDTFSKRLLLLQSTLYFFQFLSKESRD